MRTNKYIIGYQEWDKKLIAISKHTRNNKTFNKFHIKCTVCFRLNKTEAPWRLFSRPCGSCRTKFYIWQMIWEKQVIWFDTLSEPIFLCTKCDNQSCYEWQCTCSHKVNYVWMIINRRILISMYRKKAKSWSTYQKYVFKCLDCWVKTNNSPSSMWDRKCRCSYKETMFKNWDIVKNRMVVWRKWWYYLMKCFLCSHTYTMSTQKICWCQCSVNLNKEWLNILSDRYTIEGNIYEWLRINHTELSVSIVEE